jgi:hypothetical protein
MNDSIDGLVGVILALATNALLLWQKLLIYSEGVKRPLVAGGIFGLMVGMILGSILAVSVPLVIIAGISGALAIAGFNQIVQGELDFSGRALVLYLLPLLISASLSFMGAKVSEVVRKSRSKSRAKRPQVK